jgi:hypothetical protein
MEDYLAAYTSNGFVRVDNDGWPPNVMYIIRSSFEVVSSMINIAWSGNVRNDVRGTRTILKVLGFLPVNKIKVVVHAGIMTLVLNVSHMVLLPVKGIVVLYSTLLTIMASTAYGVNCVIHSKEDRDAL